MINNQTMKNISQAMLRKEFRILTEIMRTGDFSLELIGKYEQLKNKVAVANPYDVEELTYLYEEVLSLGNLMKEVSIPIKNIGTTL